MSISILKMLGSQHFLVISLTDGLVSPRSLLLLSLVLWLFYDAIHYRVMKWMIYGVGIAVHRGTYILIISHGLSVVNAELTVFHKLVFANFLINLDLADIIAGVHGFLCALHINGLLHIQNLLLWHQLVIVAAEEEVLVLILLCLVYVIGALICLVSSI